jgi:MoxR-like ATPase
MSDSPLLQPEEIARLQALAAKLSGGLNQVLLGQGALVDTVIIGLLARGHVLLEGLPGLGKTELVKALSRLLDLDFARIQFTPDLLPGDITGSPILEQDEAGHRRLVFRPGPIFGNLVLADEINRASPKTQAALLEAMQESAVTVHGETRPLPRPFFVLATQNPIELEGTYPLPEAQLDRFLFKIDVLNVDAATLSEIVGGRLRGQAPAVEAALSSEDLEKLFAAVDRIHLPPKVADYIGALVAASSPRAEGAPEIVRQFVRYGASPRAAIGLASAGRAAALMAGKPNLGFDEVRRVAHPILRHRLVLGYQAGLEGVTTDAVVDALLDAVPELSRAPEAVE